MASTTPTMDCSGEATLASASTRKIVVFLALTFALSAIFYALIIESGAIHGYSWGLMWCPGVAALLTQLIFQRNIRGMGWSIKPSRYGLLSYGLSLGYGSIVYGIVWLTGLGTFAPEAMARQTAAQLNLFWRKRGMLPAGLGVH